MDKLVEQKILWRKYVNQRREPEQRFLFKVPLFPVRNRNIKGVTTRIPFKLFMNCCKMVLEVVIIVSTEILIYKP